VAIAGYVVAAIVLAVGSGNIRGLYSLRKYRPRLFNLRPILHGQLISGYKFGIMAREI
jgi:hypothetical protein